MEGKGYIQYLLQNYHQLKNRTEYIVKLLKSPGLEKFSDTIEELNYKREGELSKGRSP